MKIIFGDYKVAITCGLIKDSSHGCVKLQKLLKAGILSESNIGDVPVILEFKTINGIDALIDALEYTREQMKNVKVEGRL